MPKEDKPDFAATIKQKIDRELDDSSFLAFSDIEATEKQLHGNAGTVVYLDNAKAIVKNALDAYADALRDRNQQLQQWLTELIKIIPVGTKITQCDPEFKEEWVVETADPEQWRGFHDRLDAHLQKFEVFLKATETTETTKP